MADRERRGLILQHGPDGPPAILGEWLAEREVPHQVHATWRDPLPARPEDYAWIASLGSEHTPGSPRRARLGRRRDRLPASCARRRRARPRPLLRRPGAGGRRGRPGRSPPSRRRSAGTRSRPHEPDADPAGAVAALPLRPARAAARLADDRALARRPGGVRARSAASGSSSIRVDPGDRRRVGAPGRRALGDRRGRPRGPIDAGSSAPHAVAADRRQAAVRRLVGDRWVHYPAVPGAARSANAARARGGER